MPQIRPIKDLRNTNKISDLCHKQNEPVFKALKKFGESMGVSIYNVNPRSQLKVFENISLDKALQ